MIFVYVTFSSQQEAEKVSKALLEKRLIACANILPEHRSVYRWEEKITTAQETAAIFKTRKELFNKMETEIKALHSYDVPCIVALPIEEGHAPFLGWIAQETAPQTG